MPTGLKLFSLKSTKFYIFFVNYASDIYPFLIYFPNRNLILFLRISGYSGRAVTPRAIYFGFAPRRKRAIALAL